jgi:biotin synthase
MKTNLIIENLLSEKPVEKNELISLLNISDKDEMQELFKAAYKVKLNTVGPVAYFRGIIEMSNQCIKDCFYCGIRRSNTEVERYLMNENEVVKTAMWAHEQRYGSMVLQTGERQDDKFTEMIERILLRIKEESDGELGVTLSLGEQSEEVYQTWFNAGAHRYLLRIETTNKNLYSQLHPPDHSFDERLNCLKKLRNVGYQVGTGVMQGLPGQTTADLVDDIIFFKDMDIDMIGMGPYIVHDQTPLANQVENYNPDTQFDLGLKMIAVSRLFLRDVNIAATTALQALNPTGRELGLQAGANIIMPNITDTKYRKAYQLYEGKPCLEDSSGMCKGCLSKRIDSIGETIGLGKWGDSPHFEKRKNI